jgi:3-oxoadipate enol-lactonase
MPRIPIGDVSLQVVIEGEGEPLLLVHGFPLDHSLWRHQIAHFSRSRQVIAPDLRGFGRSDVTAGTVRMEQFADDLARLLTALGVVRPVCLCGLSMGGYIAFAFVQRHRERLGSLVLCDTRAAADSPETRKHRWETAERVLREGPGFLAETMVDRLLAPTTRQQQPELAAEVQAVIRAAPPEGVAAASRGMAERPSVEELLPRIDLPTLVVVGEQDAISPPAEMRELARKIPAAQFVPLADAGHLAPLEQPAAMNAALDRFLQE